MNENFIPAGFREVSCGEQKEINGGFWPAVLTGVLVAATAEIIRDWDNFKNGLMGRPEEKVIVPQ
jgi:hypothetical protein